MMSVEINQTVPSFSLHSTSGEEVSIESFQGKNVVLYFYPKDDTPGCTQESIEFSQAQKEFAKHNTIILGLSRDTLKSHDKFKQKHALTCDLLSDIDQTVCHLFEVLKEKNMYGKKVIGIERSTFLIDTKGTVRQIWCKVKVDGHVVEVLDAVKALSHG